MRMRRSMSILLGKLMVGSEGMQWHMIDSVMLVSFRWVGGVNAKSPALPKQAGLSAG